MTRLQKVNTVGRKGKYTCNTHCTIVQFKGVAFCKCVAQSFHCAEQGKIEHCELINYKDSWSCGNSSEGSAGSGTGSNNPSFIADITVIV